MTEEEANRAIDEALVGLASFERVGDDYFLDPRFATVDWLPTYVRRVGDRTWGIELYRGDRIPDATLSAMVEVSRIDQTVQPAFFVPEGERYDHLLQACTEHGIALIAKVADAYECLIFPGVQPAAVPLVIRVPEWLLGELENLTNLAAAFRSAIVSFVKGYRRLLVSSELDDETQERLLKRTLGSFLRADPMFAANLDPLALLRFFEQNPFHHGRDHYFHTFVNLLLGYVIIDRCYAHFESFIRSCFPGAAACSLEYTWLLTVVFHDVGYPIQRYEETSELIFGVPAIDAEQAIAERKRAWQTPPYVTSRIQLVSLYEHLIQKEIASSWSADPFSLAPHPLDSAFEKSFLERGHGVASAMRMLADFFRNIPGSAAARQFLVRHIFLSGLSIPFHDWPVRAFLREQGISGIRTSRFPLAALLMFIDSIQEDRRGQTQAPDVLLGVSCDGQTIRSVMDLSLLPPDKLAEKRAEARDVKDFLEEDLLTFEYPDGLR